MDDWSFNADGDVSYSMKALDSLAGSLIHFQEQEQFIYQVSYVLLIQFLFSPQICGRITEKICSVCSI